MPFQYGDRVRLSQLALDRKIEPKSPVGRRGTIISKRNADRSLVKWDGRKTPDSIFIDYIELAPHD